MCSHRALFLGCTLEVDSPVRVMRPGPAHSHHHPIHKQSAGVNSSCIKMQTTTKFSLSVSDISVRDVWTGDWATLLLAKMTLKGTGGLLSLTWEHCLSGLASERVCQREIWQTSLPWRGHVYWWVWGQNGGGGPKRMACMLASISNAWHPKNVNVWLVTDLLLFFKEKCTGLVSNI